MDNSTTTLKQRLLHDNAASHSINGSKHKSKPKVQCNVTPALLRSSVAAVLAVLFSMLSSLFWILAPLQVIGGTYMSNPDNMLDSVAAFGAFWYLAGLVINPFTLGYVSWVVAQHRKLTRRKRAALIALQSVQCLVIVSLCFQYLIQPKATFCTNPQPDTFRIFLGGFLIVIYGILMFTTAKMAQQAMSEPNNGYDAQAPSSRVPKAVQPYGCRFSWRAAVLFFMLFGFCMFLTSFLSPVWNYSATSYFPATSPYSLVNAVWNTGLNYNDTDIYPDHTWNPPIIVVKLYEDVCVYFGVVFGITALGFLAMHHKPTREILHTRLVSPSVYLQRVLGMPSLAKLSLFPEGVTVGELLLVCSFWGLFAYWFYFWGFDYQRIRVEAANMADVHPNYQIAARVIGHLTTLVMSFMVLPIARNSVWEQMFGVPFDRAIKYHRVLGRMTWTLVTAHMLAWQIKWGIEGVLRNNLFTVTDLVISTGVVLQPDGSVTPAPGAIHDDNFTIPVVHIAWLLLTIALIFANVSRRASYVLFQYTHYVVYFFFLAALLHAWTHWYYMLGGLTLLAFDKAYRLLKASRRVTVLRAKHTGGVTILEVSADFMMSWGTHFAGQYAFLTVPSLSNASHPFTISSAPQAAEGEHGQRVITFHIKSMGRDKWTGQLAQLVSAVKGRAEDIPLCIEGPYGRAGHYFDRKTVVLVAGGIGITPFHSILVDLYHRKRNPQRYGPLAVERVHLVWVTRTPAMATLFADSFAKIAKDNEDGFVTFHLFCTSKQGLATDAESQKTTVAAYEHDGLVCSPANAQTVAEMCKQGRPQLADIFAQVAAATPAPHRSNGVGMVCGPASLVHDVSENCFRHSFDFHTEMFSF